MQSFELVVTQSAARLAAKEVPLPEGGRNVTERNGPVMDVWARSQAKEARY